MVSDHVGQSTASVDSSQPLQSGAATTMSGMPVEDRRRHPRTPVDCVVHWQPLGPAAFDSKSCGHDCVSHDISAGGMQIWADRTYPVGCQVLLAFECERAGVRRVTSALATVAWLLPVSAEPRWQIGVRFGDRKVCDLAPGMPGCV